jgi:hypothetical protein
MRDNKGRKQMKKSRLLAWRRLAVAGVCGLLAVVAGCSDQTLTDEPPPEGKGSLVLDNFTSDTINVFVGGVQTSIVYAADESVVYLVPGLYRVVLDQEHGARNYRDDVDILLGRQTVLSIDYDLTNATLYRVTMEFD